MSPSWLQSSHVKAKPPIQKSKAKKSVEMLLLAVFTPMQNAKEKDMLK